MPRRDHPTPAELREQVLEALRALLDEHSFSSLSVADVLAAAGVSRASFYFYFPSKQAALAELVRRAVGAGHAAAEPWTGGETDPRAALRAGISAGADLWLANAGVLRAIVESWGGDAQLRELWLAQMETFTRATASRIRADAAAMRRLDGADVDALAASLTWLGERLYYLAAARVPPFDDRDVLVAALERLWVSVLYGVELTEAERRQSNRGV